MSTSPPTDLVPLRPDGDPLAQLLPTYLDGCRSKLTADTYRRDIIHWLTWCQTSTINPLTAWPADVKRWQRHLSEHGGRNGTGEAGTSRARRLGAVSGFYNWLIEHQVVERNPAALTRGSRPVRAPRQAAALSDEHAGILLRQADLDTPRAAAIVWLLLHSGIRVGEMLAANVADIGMDRGYTVLHVHGKGGKGRTVSLPGEVTTRLDAYQASRTDHAAGTVVLRGQAGVTPVRPLIATEKGNRLDRKAIRHLLRRLGKAAKLPPTVVEQLHPHVTRATYVTASLADGVPIYDVARDVGHASTDTTRGYDRSRYDPNRSAAFRLAARFGRHVATEGDPQ
ncbi:tyrosine-type recombinase/integrase [Micromonospora arborensis]|uniref:tyrosine-type recombinase/integrase n=1 Tax=Micromonospora arborensis TaxID=2116518 RepID=UPI0033F28D9E